MEPQSVPKFWTDEELMSLPDVGGKYELVDGELIVAAAGLRHDVVIMALGEFLRGFVRSHRLGVVAGPSLGCRMSNGNVRSPDLSFVERERGRRQPNKGAGFLEGAPDLAVEVLSPSDRIAKVKLKAMEYFDNGCRLCWIIDPWDRTVLVVRPDGSEELLGEAQTLRGEPVLEGFSLPIPRLFEDLDSLEE